SAVLVDHCRRSQAGLYYGDRWEFVEALKLLMKDGALRSAMGANGKAYVDRHYGWSTILTKYERMFARLRGTPREPEASPQPQVRPRPEPAERPQRERPRGHERRRHERRGRRR